MPKSLAWRATIVTVVVTAIVVYGGSALLRYDMAQTTVSFVMFAALFGGTAWFLGNEVATYRATPHRDRYVCSEGHVSYDPGVCDCGRRLQLYVPPDIWPRIRRMLWLGLAMFVVLMGTGIALNLGR